MFVAARAMAEGQLCYGTQIVNELSGVDEQIKTLDLAAADCLQPCSQPVLSIHFEKKIKDLWYIAIAHSCL
jgi:hypothetical protein